jgi:hypothetical protein
MFSKIAPLHLPLDLIEEISPAMVSRPPTLVGQTWTVSTSMMVKGPEDHVAMDGGYFSRGRLNQGLEVY